MKFIFFLFTFITVFSSCKEKNNIRKLENKDQHTIVQPGIGTEKFIVGKTNIKNVFVELGKPNKFTQGITDYTNREATFENRYFYIKEGLTFITETDESKGEDIENAVIEVIIFEENSKAKTSDGLAIGGVAGKINYVYGKQDKDRTPNPDYPYFYYRKKGLTVEIDPDTKNINEFIIYQPYE